MPKVYTELETSYIPEEDVTIVWQNMYMNADGDHLLQRALVGWYCGEPDEETTEHYAIAPLIGQYLD